ncbi:UNVERIFIED_CONTAM: Transcriptional regulators [Acetivibrio alkalicellulosi]
MKKGEVLDKVYKSNLPSRAKQIMFYLINRANIEGTCFPSIKTIARDCGVSDRTVQRTIKILVESGFIKKNSRYREKGGQTSNLYTIDVQGVTDNKKEKTELLESNQEVNVDDRVIENISFENYNNENLNNYSRIKEDDTKEFLENSEKKEDEKTNNKFICEFIGTTRRDLAEVILCRFLCHGEGVNLFPP